MRTPRILVARALLVAAGTAAGIGLLPGVASAQTTSSTAIPGTQLPVTPKATPATTPPTATTAPASTGGTGEGAAGAGATGAPDHLARTGIDLLPTVDTGLVLVGAGAALVLAARRSRRQRYLWDC